MSNRLHHTKEALLWTRSHIRLAFVCWGHWECMDEDQRESVKDMRKLSLSQIRIHSHKIINPWWDETEGAV